MRSIDFSNITFFQMQMCLSIMEHGSFTRAAEACHISQPTLSKRLSELENHLGILLFIRGKNTKVRVTPGGKVILDEWKTILTQMEHSLQKGYRAQANMSPSIVIGSVPSMDIDCFLTPLVNSYMENRPDVDFRFIYGSATAQVEGVLNGEIDVIFVATFRKELLERAPMKSVQLLETDWYAGMLPTNHFSEMSELTFGDLRQQRFILPSPQLFGDYYTFIESMCKSHGYLPQVSFFTKNHMSLPVNVRTDDEVFLVDGFSSLIKDKTFKFVKITGVKSGMMMAYNENNDKPIIQNFQRYARSFLSELQETMH